MVHKTTIWRRNNTERTKEIKKKHYEKHKAKIIERKKIYYLENWPYSQFGQTVRNARENAKQRNVPFDLTTKDLRELYNEQGGVCAISKLEFKRNSANSGPTIFSAGLDRIVPSRGHIRDNVRFILHGLNALKSNGTDEDIFIIVRAVAKQIGDPICPVDNVGMN